MTWLHHVGVGGRLVLISLFRPKNELLCRPFKLKELTINQHEGIK